MKEAQQAGPAKIIVKEAGPLVASLEIESEAPGCVKLDREIRAIDGLDRVDIVDMLDKKAVRDKESVHLGFAFNVPKGRHAHGHPLGGDPTGGRSASRGM